MYLDKIAQLRNGNAGSDHTKAQSDTVSRLLSALSRIQCVCTFLLMMSAGQARSLAGGAFLRQPHLHCRCPFTACSPGLIAPPSLHMRAGRSRTLAGGEAPAQAAPLLAPQMPQTTAHTITFFANGIFTVDDGELGRTNARVAYLHWHVFQACGGRPVFCWFAL